MKAKWRRRWRRVWIGALVVLVGVVAAVAGAVALTSRDTAAAVARELARAPVRVRAADVPARWREILVEAVDPRFASHGGIDPWRLGTGAPSVTALLARHVYFEHYRPGWRDLAAVPLALALDARVGKDRQLDLLFATARFGMSNGVELIGFPAAAQDIYGKRMSALSEHEFVTLVAMLASPDAMDPRTHAAANGERTRRIERLAGRACDRTWFRDVDLDGCADPPPVRDPAPGIAR